MYHHGRYSRLKESNEGKLKNLYLEDPTRWGNRKITKRYIKDSNKLPLGQRETTIS